MQLAAGGGRSRYVELDRMERNRPREQRMNLDLAVRREPDFGSYRIAGVDDANFVLRLRIQIAIGQLERRIVQRFGMIPPGSRILQHRAAQPAKRKPDQRRLEVSGIAIESGAANQVRLAREISEVVVESTRAGI